MGKKTGKFRSELKEKTQDMLERLPVVFVRDRGKIGPALGFGIGCGFGVGFGAIAGLGPIIGIPGLPLQSGLGVGCGVGLGIGYGIGYGWALDENGTYNNLENPFKKQAPKEERIQNRLDDSISSAVNELITITTKAHKAVGREIQKRAQPKEIGALLEDVASSVEDFISKAAKATDAIGRELQNKVERGK